MTKKGVVTLRTICENQFISPIFLTPKPDGTYRFILNLKKLNTFINTTHFKLEDIRTARDLMQPNCHMATLDLKDAFHLVPIADTFKKYLRFLFNEQVYEFNCLPFGLNTAPYVFTKLMKPVITFLRELGILCVIYLDDILLFENTKQQCTNNVQVTRELLEKLGFVINETKSQLEPNTKQKFLGFILNTDEMKIELPFEKREKIEKILKKFKVNSVHTIREFASLIGTLTSCCLAAKYGWAHVKDLEREKFLALENNNGNFNARIKLSNRVKDDLDWWKINIPHTFNPISSPKIVKEIFTDASLLGWGASCTNETAHGFWNNHERKMNINILELKAALFGLKCFAKDPTNCDILLRIDNTTAISYINRMGGIKFENLNFLAKSIWTWCEKRNIWIYASYISSKENTVADHESRRLETEIEYSLSHKAFKQICSTFGNPEIDIFASRINAKCAKYISWKPDPGSITVDAFTIKWDNLFFFAFPPFALIPKVLKKITNDNAKGILVVPHWPSQAWFPRCMQMFNSPPIIFKPEIDLLCSSNREPHPLWSQLSLVCRMSLNRHID